MLLVIDLPVARIGEDFLKLKDIVARLPAGNIATLKILEEIRVKNNKVPWHKLIRFALHIPKHSIIAWMVVLNRLPTKDKLSSQGLNVDMVCLLCNRADESRDHML
ncbi:hypothetical protein PVK06_012791 [Gossypium arboreum]|uniref:Reverse transcriptase zinc-binding domain-containing protein n=1 Tax=Gossypium arboreum TaxID=29729 RepID=A0ABR0QCE6_GOSAR|nr:hypothetical protein PVK06_012791 [Gossypium arboreum]